MTVLTPDQQHLADRAQSMVKTCVDNGFDELVAKRNGHKVKATPTVAVLRVDGKWIPISPAPVDSSEPQGDDYE